MTKQIIPTSKERPFYKKKRFLIPAVLVLAMSSLLGNRPDGESVNTSNSSSTTTAKVANSPEKTKEKLKRELASLDKPFDNSPYQGSIESIQLAPVLFGAYKFIIKEGKDSPDEENKKLADQLRKKVSAIQIKEFPTLRKRYAEIAAEKVWERDVYVTISGANNSVINFTGGMFATNKNIASVQKSITDILTQLRFKEVRYRWYKNANEFTSYTLETPKDAEPF